MSDRKNGRDILIEQGKYRPIYPDSPFIHIADIVNEETGKTYREENAEKAHAIPLGALVETNTGTRLFVVWHGRDCDMTPLYSLAMDTEYLGKDPGDFPIHERVFWKWDHGYPEDCLTVIRDPDKPANLQERQGEG